uniref:Uncharacterized protein n=1 Tax=Urocitellus parryii TaxID=9999 RepID=A0A8D2H569_UROPR
QEAELELIFQIADSDRDYIQFRLEYEIKTNHPDSAIKRVPVLNLQASSSSLFLLFYVDSCHHV